MSEQLDEAAGITFEALRMSRQLILEAVRDGKIPAIETDEQLKELIWLGARLILTSDREIATRFRHAIGGHVYDQLRRSQPANVIPAE